MELEININQAAALLGMTPATIFRKLSEGKIPGATKDGHNRWRFTLDGINEYLDIVEAGGERKSGGQQTNRGSQVRIRGVDTPVKRAQLEEFCAKNGMQVDKLYTYDWRKAKEKQALEIEAERVKLREMGLLRE